MASSGKLPDTVKSPLHRLQSAIVKDMSFGASRDTDHSTTPSRSRIVDHPNFDSESVYSFDSVSTSGRLLDRLDLDSEDYYDDDDFSRRRESFASIQSTGRLLDRLGLDENSDELTGVMSPSDRYKPILANSSSNLERMKSSSSLPSRTPSGRMPLKSASHKVVQQKGNFSVDSLQGDVASLSHSSATSIPLLDSSSGSSTTVPHTPMRINSKSKSFPSETSIPETGSDSSGDRGTSALSLPTIYGHNLRNVTPKLIQGQFGLPGGQYGLPSGQFGLPSDHKSIQKSNSYIQHMNQNQNQHNYQVQGLSKGHRPAYHQHQNLGLSLNSYHQNQNQNQNQNHSHHFAVRQNLPNYHQTQQSYQQTLQHHQQNLPNYHLSLQSHQQTLHYHQQILLPYTHHNSPDKRNVSGSSNTSNTSLENGIPMFNPSSRFDPSLEASTKKAIQLRMLGNHREASYQLQISASPPYNYPKAMYLYAQALKLGQGVKLNEALAVKWLCRCVLVSYIIETTALDEPSLSKYVSRLNELPPGELLKLVKQNIDADNLDPFVIFDEFLSYPSSTVTRIVTSNLKDGNTVGGAYYQLGKSLIQGSGVPKDEVGARLVFAKSASLGYGDAMVALGELWSSKSKHFKKDLTIAALWLRIGEMFGKKDLGNSWIYKEKYMERPKVKK